MTEEFEMKIQLSKEEYSFLIELFRKHISSASVQTNYYYDTPAREFRQQNTTVRIRHKGHNFKGTVKKHLAEKHCSTERSFSVKNLPHSFETDGKRVYMQGQLKTYRVEVPITDFAVMMIDKNEYLDQIDYEMELEYSEDTCREANGMMQLVEKLLGRREKSIEPVSKSERFFRRLEVIEHEDLSSEGRGWSL